jgi:hypothetical protein
MQNRILSGSPIAHRCDRVNSTVKGARLRLIFLAMTGLVLSCLSTACADLTEVAKFAASAKSASTGYSDIVDDFAASATRRSLYVRDKEKPEVLAQAQSYKDEQPAMLAALKPLTGYFAALAAISTDSKTDKDKDDPTSPIEGNLEKVGMSSGQATAAVGLAAKVSNALAAGYRSDKAGKAIHDCNPELQTYLAGLEHIVGTDYPLVLATERTSVQGYYADLAAKYGDKEPLAALILQGQEQEVLDGIDKREKAAAAYVKILTDIGTAHQKLFDAGEKITTAQLVSIVEPQVSDIVVQSVAVAKAF